jgi:hypothetical protein
LVLAILRGAVEMDGVRAHEIEKRVVDLEQRYAARERRVSPHMKIESI